ncbi:MAG: glycerophosphodiester phosphodiesterase family protein, partial [Bacillota bacterium]
LNELMPDLPCSVLTAVSTFEEFVDVTRKAKTKAIDLYHARLEREVAEKLLDRAYVLWVWTVDDVKSMRRAVDLGITGITTNKPKLAIELFR